MTENSLAALILAGGQGTRMKSELCKVLHRAAGRPLIHYVVDSVEAAGIPRTVVVVGHQAEAVKESLSDRPVEFVLQEPQLGTGHAVASAEPLFAGFQGHVVILCGDVPFVQPDTIRGALESGRERSAAVVVITAKVEDPGSYGRIVRNEHGDVVRIVEQRDANPDELAIDEINTGMYVVDAGHLFTLLNRLSADNAQQEYYLTDIVAEAVAERLTVHGYTVEDPLEITGVNTRADLAFVTGVIRNGLCWELMHQGVTLVDPASVYVDFGVVVGPDTIIHPGVTLTGNTSIGSGCVIEPGVFIKDCIIGDRVEVRLGSRLEASTVGDGSTVGPMAHLRPEADIGKNARIGNFVEVKKTKVGDGSKASHLTYLGDSVIGEKVNIGCGTITCNYDGRAKHKTIIGDRCFVGSDVQFVAPVEIGEGSLIGAGSTITRDVPEGTLAVSRARQKNYKLRNNQGPKSEDEDRNA